MYVHSFLWSGADGTGRRSGVSQAQVSRRQSGTAAWSLADGDAVATDYGIGPLDLLAGPTRATPAGDGGSGWTGGDVCSGQTPTTAAKRRPPVRTPLEKVAV